jgi:4-amino-4-deoxychorismate lyase
MSLLVETIRIENGKILNISFHNERMIRSLYNIYGLMTKPELEKIIEVPASANQGIYKCRLIYDDKSRKVEFLPYELRPVRTLKMIFSDEICYPYKYANRDKINRLFDMRGECDDILIVKYGKLCDSSYANVVFKEPGGSWVTPSTCLLPGTRRAALLKSGFIKEADISYSDLSKYIELKLINAMIDIDETEGIPVSSIIAGS